MPPTLSYPSLGLAAVLPNDYSYDPVTSSTTTLDPRIIGVKDAEGDTLGRAVLPRLYAEDYQEGDTDDEATPWDLHEHDGVSLYTIPGSFKNGVEEGGSWSPSSMKKDDDAEEEEEEYLSPGLIKDIATLALPSQDNMFTTGLPYADSESGTDLYGASHIPNTNFIDPLKLNQSKMPLAKSPSDLLHSDNTYEPEGLLSFHTEYDEDELGYNGSRSPSTEDSSDDGEQTRELAPVISSIVISVSDNEFDLDFDGPSEENIERLVPNSGTWHFELNEEDNDFYYKNDLSPLELFLTIAYPQHGIDPPSSSAIDDDSYQELWANSGWNIPRILSLKLPLFDPASEDAIESAQTEDYAYTSHPQTYDDLPIGRGLKLVTCGSTIREDILSLHISHIDGHQPDEEHYLNDFGYPLETEEEFAVRRTKEKTINHNDFASFDEEDLALVFTEEISVSDQPLHSQPHESLPLSGQWNISNYVPHSPPYPPPSSPKQVFTLYAKDKSDASIGSILLDDDDFSEDWILSIDRAFGLDTEDSDNSDTVMAFTAQLSSSPVETLSGSEGYVILSLESGSATSKRHTPMPELSEGNPTPVDSPSSSSGSLSKAVEVRDKEGIMNGVSLVPGVLNSEKSLSPPGTMTALLVSHTQGNQLFNPKGRSHFQERCHSGGPADLSRAQAQSQWTLNNRFASLPLPQLKRRRSIRRIFFPKSSQLPDTQPEGAIAQLRAQSEPHRVEDDRKAKSESVTTTGGSDNKPGTGFRSLWRSKTFGRKPRAFNLESGVSLEGTVSDYLTKHDLKLPVEDEFMSNDTESVRRMLSVTGKKEKEEQKSIETDLSVSDSQETLTSLVREKVEGFIKPLSDHVPTPAPFPTSIAPRTEYIEERRHHFLGLGRSKTVSLRPNPTIRFVDTPMYIKGEGRSEVDANINGLPTEDSHKSILKRSSTYSEHGFQKPRSFFRSMFGK